MNGLELDRQKRTDIEWVLQGLIWCLPLPFLMGLKVGIDFYILGPAYFIAMIRQKKWQLPAVLLAYAGVLMLPTGAMRWKYGLLILLFWAEEGYLERYKPLWPSWKRCVFYVAGLMVVVTGLSIAGVLRQYQMVAVFLEAVFLVGASCLYQGLYQGVLTGRRIADEVAMAGVSLTFGTILAAFHWVQLGPVIPAEIFLISMALVGSFELGIGKGMVLVLPAGFFMRLTMTAGEGLLILAVLSAVLIGAFRDMGRRAAAAAAFSGGCLWVILFMGGHSVVPGILTMGAACLIFGMLSMGGARKRLIRLLGKVKKEEEEIRKSTDARKRYLEHQMGQSAEAFRQIADLIAVPPKQKKITGQDLVYLKEDIAGSLCHECEKQRVCWGKQYARTHETVVRVMEASRQKGKVERKDLPAAFLETCEHATDFVRTVNRHYELYRLNQSWENRMAQSAQLVQEQYEAMAVYLDQMRMHFAGELEAEERIRRKMINLLKQQGIRMDRAEVMADEREDRIWIHLDAQRKLSDRQLEQCQRLLTELTGRHIVLMQSIRVAESGIRYRFSDPNSYCLQLGCVSGSYEELSGDCYTAQRLDAQRFVLALGDGMGSGVQAHEASERALALLEQLLLSGVEEEQAVRMLNTALVLTNPNEIFTTIDLALLNLHTGQLKLVKAGSCTTFLRSRSSVYVYRSQSLPVGILDEPEPETYSHPVEHGDILLMISDGVLDQLPEPKQAERWIKRYLLQSQEEDPQQLAEDLQEMLMPHLPQVEDDRTILAVRIEKKEKT